MIGYIVIAIYLLALSIFIGWHIRSDRQFRQYMKHSQYFSQNFLEPIAENYTAITNGKADLEIAFYVPLPDRETGLVETVQSVRPVFPDATIEPYRTNIEIGGKEIPVLQIVLPAHQRLSREQHDFLKELPLRATIINKK